MFGRSSVVFGGNVLSMLLGLVLQIFLASRLGASEVADVFYLGSTLPSVFAVAILSSSYNGLIRVAVEDPASLNLGTERNAARMLLMCGLIGTFILAMVAVTCLRFDDLGLIQDLGGSSFAWFLLIVSPVPLLVSIASIGAVVALSEERMLLATWGGAVNGLGLLVSVLWLSGGHPSTVELAVGVDIGYLSQLALVATQLRPRQGGHSVGEKRLQQAKTGVLFLFAASLFYKAQPLIERFVGSMLGDGIPALLGYVDKVAQGYSQFAVFGFALASLPLLSKHMAGGNDQGASKSLGQSLAGTAMVTALVVPTAVATASEVIQIVYGRGQFGQSDVELATQLLQFSSISVALGALASPLVASLYASGRVRLVVWIGIQGFVVSVVGTSLLAWLLGPNGVVLGSASGFGYTFIRFALVLESELGFWSWKEWWNRHGRLVTGGALGAVLAGAVALLAPWPDSQSMLENAVVAIWKTATVAFGWLLGLLGGKALATRRNPRAFDPNAGTDRVLWLTLSDQSIASSRVRAYEMAEALTRVGVRSRLVKASGMRGRMRVLAVLLGNNFDVIVIQKIMVGYMFLRILRFSCQKLVFECDDAIHLEGGAYHGRFFGSPQRRIDRILSVVDFTTTTNQLLAKELEPHRGRSLFFLGPAPGLASSSHDVRQNTVLWLGSPSTSSELERLGVIPRDTKIADARFVAVGAGEEASRFGWTVVEWSESAASGWLSQASVGIMPLSRSDWNDRKAGYKLLEYAAHGVVPVASNGPVSQRILKGAFSELLVGETDDWWDSILAAMENRGRYTGSLHDLVERHSAEVAASDWVRIILDDG